MTARRTEQPRSIVRRFDVTDSDVLDALDVLDRFFLLVGVLRDSGFIRCGDIVKHGPTGETWVVAYADYARNDLAWSGWPEGVARITDCYRLTAVCDAAHRAEVDDWLDPARFRNDHRPSAVRRLYGAGCT